jgi:hypothetical protein
LSCYPCVVRTRATARMGPRCVFASSTANRCRAGIARYSIGDEGKAVGFTSPTALLFEQAIPSPSSPSYAIALAASQCSPQSFAPHPSSAASPLIAARAHSRNRRSASFCALRRANSEQYDGWKNRKHTNVALRGFGWRSQNQCPVGGSIT